MTRNTLHIFIILFIISLISISVSAQKMNTVSGIVLGKDTNEPVEFAVVGFKEINKWTTTNKDGEFIIKAIAKGSYTFQVSFISYKDYSQRLSVKSNILRKRVLLSKTDISLREVVVIAKESKSSNTSSNIKREAISHLQPSSFSELLELLPGNSSHDPHLGGVNIVSMRQIGADNNTSLGTSFVIDGAPISNDGNIQSISGSWEKKISKRASVGKGVDMRVISTDDIESVEIVRGIPSVMYGDLNSGLINITRKKGYSPFKIRLKADPNSKLIFLGKGYSLSESSSINMSLDYINYKSDPRNVLENYQRLSSSIRYNKRIESDNNIILLSSNIDYTGSFDDDKEDKEINYGVKDYYSSSYNNIRLSSSVKWNKLDSKYFKGIDFRLTSSYTQDKQIRDKLVSKDRDIPWTTSRQEGVHDGIYLPNEYQAYLEVDAKPVNLFSQISTKIAIPIYELYNDLLIGFDYKYDKNLGKGELFNPNRPAYISSSRPRAYSDVPSQQRLAFFLEDNSKMTLGDYSLNLVAGLRFTKLLNLSSRYDISNKLFIEPRLNMQIRFPEFNIGDQDIRLSINAGIGEHKRFPVLSHLYPNNRYLDLVQLNYYHQTKEYRRVSFDTHIINPTNYSISEASNKKLEIGVDLDISGNNFSITAFREKLSSGFRTKYGYTSFVHKKYDNQSVDFKTITDQPRLEDMSFALDTNVYMYGQAGNGSLLIKKGIEFQFDFKRMKSLHTKLTINGAWFKTTYSNSMPVLKSRCEVLNGETIDFIGEYDWDSGYTRERLNTNLRFDTQIPKIGLVFSSLIECMWYSSRQSIRKDCHPIRYIDKEGKSHPFTKESEDDYRLNWLVLNFNDNVFKKEIEPFAASMNLKITKTFSNNISLAMYVNRLLSYLPVYEQNGFEINRRSSPYFGMELRISLGKAS